ncbi:unnamed protein product [Pedinophyceae sp. YPF-701]|nr:unnamed protein product [Pedinophyceae sp. YPF-701]
MITTRGPNAITRQEELPPMPSLRNVSYALPSEGRARSNVTSYAATLEEGGGSGNDFIPQLSRLQTMKKDVSRALTRRQRHRSMQSGNEYDSVAASDWEEDDGDDGSDVVSRHSRSRSLARSRYSSGRRRASESRRAEGDAAPRRDDDEGESALWWEENRRPPNPHAEQVREEIAVMLAGDAEYQKRLAPNRRADEHATERLARPHRRQAANRDAAVYAERGAEGWVRWKTKRAPGAPLGPMATKEVRDAMVRARPKVRVGLRPATLDGLAHAHGGTYAQCGRSGAPLEPVRASSGTQKKQQRAPDAAAELLPTMSPRRKPLALPTTRAHTEEFETWRALRDLELQEKQAAKQESERQRRVLAKAYTAHVTSRASDKLAEYAERRRAQLERGKQLRQQRTSHFNLTNGGVVTRAQGPGERAPGATGRGATTKLMTTRLG